MDGGHGGQPPVVLNLMAEPTPVGRGCAVSVEHARICPGSLEVGSMGHGPGLSWSAIAQEAWLGEMFGKRTE